MNKLAVFLLVGISGTSALQAQRQELGLTLGRLGEQSRTNLTLQSGNAMQANYGYRLTGSPFAALYVEVNFLASPQRVVQSTNLAATRDVASLFLTPGLRLKFFPGKRLQPYVTAGGGYALYEHSRLNLAGNPNAAPRTDSTSAFTFGGGVDIPVWRFLGARFEVRDFYTGNPIYNVPVGSSRQHNVFVGGGLFLRF